MVTGVPAVMVVCERVKVVETQALQVPPQSIPVSVPFWILSEQFGVTGGVSGGGVTGGVSGATLPDTTSV